MRRADPGQAALADRNSRTVDEAGPEPLGEHALYDVLLLAGAPKRHTCLLQAGIEEGALIDVAGESWTVADVRAPSGTPNPVLVCIYAS